MSKWVPSSSTTGFALAARFMIEEKCGGDGVGRGSKVLIIELYSINDCFRMSDHIQLLEDRHVNVV